MKININVINDKISHHPLPRNIIRDDFVTLSRSELIAPVKAYR